MAVTRLSEASPTIGTTEYSLPAASTTLPTRTEIGFVVLTLDLNAVALGDVFELAIYESARSSGGTKRVMERITLYPQSGKPIVEWPAPGGSLLLGNGWDVTLKKISGTDRVIPFTLWITQ